METGWFIAFSLFIALTGGAVALLIALLASPRIGRGLAIGGIGAGLTLLTWLAFAFAVFPFHGL